MTASIKRELFGDIDFTSLKDNLKFKESDVREEIIMPLLSYLGYGSRNIIRELTLHHPFLHVGSNKDKPITLIPDYVFRIENSYAWVLDAKGPRENLQEKNYVEQAYCYAAHPEVRSNYFALCNGIEFVLYRTNGYNEPLLHFFLDEIDYYVEKLKILLSPDSFHLGKQLTYIPSQNADFDYLTRKLPNEIKTHKQAAKRHFGVHGYFTKQSWDIVQEYIKNFSKPGDIVLDPFGGTGVTAIEAWITNRKGINVDINPMAIFMVDALTTMVNQNELVSAFDDIKRKYLKHEPKTEEEIAEAILKYPQPKPIPLTKDSDVKTADMLFSDKQKAQLGYLKYLILKQKDENVKKTLMLMFSGLVTKINLTYHQSDGRSEGRGNASAFAYYRYRLAKQPVELDVMKYFEIRLRKVIEAKNEIRGYVNDNTKDNLKIVKGSATDLKFISSESVDNIYTDPPYGAKIAYLDLSAMWNAWLDIEPTEEDYQNEAIEGGGHSKSKSDYNKLISESIKEMYRVLKFDRWMSFVFAHKDPEFWHLIIDTAEQCGFEYVGAVPQKNGQSSFKKRQNPFTVLSGQLIINFKKVRTPKAMMKAHLGMDTAEMVIQTIEGVIANNDGATIEQINDELILKGLELGFLDLLKKEYTDLTPILKNNFDYDSSTQKYQLRKNTAFSTHIDVNMRIRYILRSFLVRMERERQKVTFDDIILNVIPLLRNGSTPENQTVLKVLEDIGQRSGDNYWTLKKNDQQLNLFG
ncbi:DNA methyltransferase [Prevotella sp. E13-27]|uniref:DNA methyltransferase n=1 Tax=Prevotella sp. E13-27 TaxID=2938122 RepID=UPI00200AB873|nr:DNA methyltransferase [Prevotella sp. E13-27]MCK8623697.1 type I restriction enzyme HsdR N-terminal domain-containing protein [Prevotella sp. E13-27]